MTENLEKLQQEKIKFLEEKEQFGKERAEFNDQILPYFNLRRQIEIFTNERESLKLNKRKMQIALFQINAEKEKFAHDKSQFDIEKKELEILREKLTKSEILDDIVLV